MSAESPRPSRLSNLTARELQVLEWVAEGKSNGDVGRILSCAERTVKKHLQHIFIKLGVETRTTAAAIYWQENPHLAGPHGSSDTGTEQVA